MSQKEAQGEKLHEGQERLSESSPLKSDSSRDCQVGGWTALLVVKDTQKLS
jgi:hypothetical protein